MNCENLAYPERAGPEIEYGLIVLACLNLFTPHCASAPLPRQQVSSAGFYSSTPCCLTTWSICTNEDNKACI